jgi:hypothetical protein
MKIFSFFGPHILLSTLLSSVNSYDFYTNTSSILQFKNSKNKWLQWSPTFLKLNKQKSQGYYI